MRFWETALRAPRAHTAGDLVRAIVVALVVPPAAGAVLLWLLPSGCDLGGEPVTHRWSCLFPWLLVTLPLVLAVLVPIALILNRRLSRPLPDGWLVVIPAVGAVTQIVLCGGYLLTLDPAYRDLFWAELPSIPQPFVAGTIVGAVSWTAFHWRDGKE